MALLAVALDNQWAMMMRGNGFTPSQMDNVPNIMNNQIGPAVARSDYRGAALAAANGLG